MSFLFLLISLLFLWLGTEILIKGALEIAELFNFSHVFTGLTILAIGTDLPELFLAIQASIQPHHPAETSQLIIGDTIGSTISQISLVMGLAGLTGYLTLTRKQIKGEGIILLMVIILTFLLMVDNEISLLDGIILLIAYLVYYVSLLRLEKVSAPSVTTKRSIYKPLLFLFLGFILVIISARFVVSNAIALAFDWGASTTFVGIVIIGLGTSLPELAVSINAAVKGSGGLSVGNLIGSNIFDLLVPIGVGAIIRPIEINAFQLLPDFIILFVISLLVLVFFTRKKGLQSIEAITLISIYGGYTVFKIIQMAG